MSPANRHPKAIVFHVALIVGLLLMHYWLAPAPAVDGAVAARRGAMALVHRLARGRRRLDGCRYAAGVQ